MHVPMSRPTEGNPLEPGPGPLRLAQSQSFWGLPRWLGVKGIRVTPLFSDHSLWEKPAAMS